MSIIVRNVVIGEGSPVIAVPIISRTQADILKDARLIAASDADIAEWRVDFFENMQDAEVTAKLALELKKLLGDKLLLFTCRTTEEGGEAAISEESYRKLLFTAAECGCADLLDAELAQSESFIEKLAATAHATGMGIIGSYHNFAETPDAEILLEKYAAMQECGADILKIAVMPRSDADVDKMIGVSKRAEAEFRKPVIAIVMGELGRCTRITCEAIGSCLTFASIGGTSAPGQIPADELSGMLKAVHENIAVFRSAESSRVLNEMIGKYCG